MCGQEHLVADFRAENKGRSTIRRDKGSHTIQNQNSDSKMAQSVVSFVALLLATTSSTSASGTRYVSWRTEVRYFLGSSHAFGFL